MKKIVGILSAAAVLAASVFALDASAAIKFNGSLFDVKSTKTRELNKYYDGNIPFVSGTSINNGVERFVRTNEILEKGNCITVSSLDCSAFYQEKDFLGRGGAGSSIILLYNENLNKYNGYFISTVIRNVCKKYFYSNMANKDTIKEEIIKLPVKENNPDWEYMTEYIQKLEKEISVGLENLESVI